MHFWKINSKVLDRGSRSERFGNGSKICHHCRPVEDTIAQDGEEKMHKETSASDHETSSSYHEHLGEFREEKLGFHIIDIGKLSIIEIRHFLSL